MSTTPTQAGTASDPTEERPIMSKRPATIALLLIAAALALIALPAASASAASPWWQVMTGSRPTNLAPSTDSSEVQKVTTQKFFGLVFAGTVEVGGTVVGCLGSGEFPPASGLGADHYCEDATGFPARETAAEFEEMLEGPYGAGGVEVGGGPVGGAPFEVATPSPVAPLTVTPITFGGIPLGTADVDILSEGSGRLVLNFTNLGSAEVDASGTPLTITDELPQGAAAYDVEAIAGASPSTSPEELGPVDCAVETTAKVTCTYSGILRPYEAIEVVVYVSLTGPTGAPGRVTVSGANAPRAGSPQHLNVSEADAPFGVQSFSARAEAEGGAEASQAGSHPYQFTTTIQLNQGPMIGTLLDTINIKEAPGLPRNMSFDLPAGLVGNATTQPRCRIADFFAAKNGKNRCQASSAIGVASVVADDYTGGLNRFVAPVFNLPPKLGEPARFGITVANNPVLIDTAVKGADGYRVQASVQNVTQLDHVLATTVSLWGAPGDSSHDSARGWACTAPYIAEGEECVRPPEVSTSSFLRLPTSCGNPLDFSALVEAWNSGERASGAFTGGALDGCNREPFDPSIEVQPDTHAGESPSGLSVHLKVPQEAGESPQGISTSDVRDTRVTLPPGLHINPAAANGLQACTEAQIGFSQMNGDEAVFDEEPAACPEASKLGKVKITTPLLEEPVTGWVYQAAQGANPFNSLLALYVVADAPDSGVHVKLAGKVETDKQTGQVVTSFDATPQLPFSEFELSIFGGAGAPLATSTCGSYKTTTQIEPWSGGTAATPSSEFQVSGCPSSQRFQPAFSAGTESPLAGLYSPFVLNLKREDGEQQLSRIDAVLPPGLSGKLAGIPYCPDAAIHQAEARSNPGEGSLEQGSPSCPAASQVGTVRVGAGVGPQPYFVNGSVYLAGPYKGGPLSLVIVTPAVAGPFDLGTVVVRTALYVDEESTQITAKSDALPTMLQGIPLDVRSIALRMDRSNFTLNPTSCAAMTLGGTATSTTGQSAALANRFQVGGCKGLDFAPRLALKVFGKTNRNAKPRLRAVLQMKPGEAAIRRAQVNLPHSEFLEQNHIKTVCTRVQFNAGKGHGEQCPKGSIYGHARAITPLLDKPVEGPVYLRSSNHKLPDLVAALNGQIDVALDGKVDSGPNKGIRNTFEMVPDAPVSKFILEMRGGKKGLLVNSENLCSPHAKTTAIARFVGQNGAVHNFKPKVANSCKKKHSKSNKRHAGRRH